MEELDLLKKNWHKTTDFEQVSEENIYGMIHKKSASIVKWILIISILEFVFLNTIGYINSDHEHSFDNEILNLVLDIFEFISYAITIFFIYLFYKNYRSISVVSSTKTLMKDILKTRKIVQYYIYYNLIYAFTILATAGFFKIFTEKLISNIKQFYACLLLISIIVIIVLIVWLFYRLLYGFLLKKLNQNYKELNALDS